MSDWNDNEECIRNPYKWNMNVFFNLVETHHAVLQMFEGFIIFSMAIKCSLILKEAAEINAAHQTAEVSDYDNMHFQKIGSK